MANLTSVGITAGVPNSGTGTVSTLDNLIGVAGTPSTQVQSVQGVSGGTAVPVSAASLPLPTGAMPSSGGSVTANIGSSGSLALETGGNLAAVAGGVGAPADAVVAAGAAGSLSAKLRAISRDLVANIVLAAGSVVKIDQTTPGTTNGVVVNAALPAGTNALGSVTISNANANGRAVPGSSAPVVLNSMTYTAVAASQTATLFGATGASGDYLDGVLIIPATAAAGVVTITDGSGSAITIFAGGGTTALPTLAPFYVPIGAISKGGAGGWKVTTGTNVSVIGVGNFT